jgi:hypothetical protein
MFLGCEDGSQNGEHAWPEQRSNGEPVENAGVLGRVDEFR